ncbi:hypothetical protein NX02_27470 [Sphingomonas sanxanigenens DSM 19645 = NX02]|uniref:Uncharacterized protein n=2 Tax=Sphingomonas sanxanigenens TaxID=397260 RepID=W0AN09_9SPHN|nr:hypothetical protein NX02_27470 [Sphingomonas sanxanigenens DSM 19645 = NX02]
MIAAARRMAEAMTLALPQEESISERWVADYRAATGGGDVLTESQGTAADAWATLFDEIAGIAGGDLGAIRDRVQRQADEIGTGYRMPGESEERAWPVSPVPLLIPEADWSGIAEGVAQRARLMDMLLADIYGAQKLAREGHIPAALITGNPYFMRPMVGLTPPGGRHLTFYAVDIARGPDGEWRVLADHLRAPVGAGYALENRLAVSRVLGGLQTRLNIQRLAAFFSAVRAGLGAMCHRADPRIGLLTPGRYNPSYAEQAHLARYLGLLLVEGDDLAVHEDRLYVRTIEGLKRVDALWRQLNPRLLDPLAFDPRSQIGVPGLIDAMAAGDVVVANSPGSGVLESNAVSAFLPRLASALLGEPLKLPNIATWWCGQQPEFDHVRAALDTMVIAPAFETLPPGLEGVGPRAAAELDAKARKQLLEDMARRPMDYVGQEVVRVSTMPTVDAKGALVPRPFTVRVFAACDAHGQWQVMPGGFARIGRHEDSRAVVIGEGTWSADVSIVATRPVEPVTLLQSGDQVRIRRNPGTLPSRVADNLFWLGRYLERGEAILGLVRAAIGGSIDADGGAALAPATIDKLGRLLIKGSAAARRAESGAADIVNLAHAALDDIAEEDSVRSLLSRARAIGEVSRDRLAIDFWRLLDAGYPGDSSMNARASVLQQRFAALMGLAAEHMGRTAAWNFHDMGRRVERAMSVARLARTFAGGPKATVDDLSTLLELTNSQIGYRQRYQTGVALLPVRDLVLLDTSNPRGLPFQVERICRTLRELPKLDDDGVPEDQEARAAALAATVVITPVEAFDAAALTRIEERLMGISDAISRRFFLQGSEPLRAHGLTLA